MAFGWRQRVEYYEAHPEAVRRHHVRRLTRNTLRQLQSDSRKMPLSFMRVRLILREQSASPSINRPPGSPPTARRAAELPRKRRRAGPFTGAGGSHPTSGAIATLDVDAALNDLNCVLVP